MRVHCPTDCSRSRRASHARPNSQRGRVECFAHRQQSALAQCTIDLIRRGSALHPQAHLRGRRAFDPHVLHQVRGNCALQRLRRAAGAPFGLLGGAHQAGNVACDGKVRLLARASFAHLLGVVETGSTHAHSMTGVDRDILPALMISVRLHNLRKDYGQTAAVDGVSMTAPAGGLTFLLGPSGCGKTTILRMIAGFLEPTGGEIFFGDRPVSRVPAEKRGCGMVFQSYALWPHMTVAQNVAFGLEVRKEPKQEIARKVGKALEMVRMGSYAERRPNQLSGGQQQRVALARAIVYNPDVLLLDEPLSNLDAKLRLEMRGEIRRIVDELKVTAIYVTHDQKESLSLADRMIVLRAGRIEQEGAPREMYERPANAFVAEFLGETNFLSGTVLGPDGADGVRVQTSAGTLLSSMANGRNAGDKLTVSVRPEALRMIDAAHIKPDAPVLRGTVADSVYLGEVAQHRVDCGGTAVKVFELNPRRTSRKGEKAIMAVDADQVVLLDA